MLATSVFGQFVESPLPSNRATTSKTSAVARIQATPDPTFLPFWDDFSSSITEIRDTLWLYGNSVLLNSGMGIQPPSINVVTFDGVDSLGKPYNVNDVLAKGYADKLVSQPIRMDLVSPGLQNTVYISFFVQWFGRGEPPDPGDVLKLSLKAQDGTWEDVLMLETNPSFEQDVFRHFVVQIADPKFFHDAFQFRFTNFARLSGKYDTWHLDYIYLNSGRTPTDVYYPDRSITTPLTSLFKDYYSMPASHFLQDISTNLVHPSIELYNLQQVGAVGGIRPFNYTTTATIDSRVNGAMLPPDVVPLDINQAPGGMQPDLIGQEFRTQVLNTIPQPSDFDADADSIHIGLQFFINSTDNVVPPLGDYNPIVYDPLDFRVNDTTTINYILSSYYAYDDGGAEYMAGLNQAGSFVAYQFTMNTPDPDTLVYVDIFFPEVGDNTNQSIQLQIRETLTDNTSITAFEQNLVVQRSTMNKFVRYPLTRPVTVQGVFYIGWKQLTNVPINVGLDKNTDNGDKIWYNTNGIWVQNTVVHGSPMIRPGFGEGNGIVTGINKEFTGADVFPNPAVGSCTIKGHVQSLAVYDISGRVIDVSSEAVGENTRVTFSAGTSGLVLVRYGRDGQIHTRKVMVRGE